MSDIKLYTKLIQAETCIDELKSALERALADGAAMRGALEKIAAVKVYTPSGIISAYPERLCYTDEIKEVAQKALDALDGKEPTP